MQIHSRERALRVVTQRVPKKIAKRKAGGTAGAITSSPEGGTSRSKQRHGSRIKEVAAPLSSCSVWASRYRTDPGRGYEPRSSRLRTSPSGRLAWSFTRLESRRADSGQSESVAHPRRGQGEGSTSRIVVSPGPSDPVLPIRPPPVEGAGHRSSATSANTGGCPADVVRCRAGVLFFFVCGAVAHLRHSRTADPPTETIGRPAISLLII